MRTVKEKKVKTRVLVSITCDKCQKEYDAGDVFEVQEFVRVSFTGGYGAVMGDGESYEADLCQYCVKELLGPVLRQVERDW